MEYPQNRLEHRWGERFPVNIPVSVSSVAFGETEGYMKNLSMSGALMEADCEVRLHILLDVRIVLPRPLLGVAVLNAHVSRRLNQGAGIEWNEFAPAIVKQLIRGLSLRLPR
jgi:PilZ domain